MTQFSGQGVLSSNKISFSVSWCKNSGKNLLQKKNVLNTKKITYFRNLNISDIHIVSHIVVKTQIQKIKMRIWVCWIKFLNNVKWCLLFFPSSADEFNLFNNNRLLAICCKFIMSNQWIDYFETYIVWKQKMKERIQIAKCFSFLISLYILDSNFFLCLLIIRLNIGICWMITIWQVICWLPLVIVIVFK